MLLVDEKLVLVVCHVTFGPQFHFDLGYDQVHKLLINNGRLSERLLKYVNEVNDIFKRDPASCFWVEAEPSIKELFVVVVGNCSSVLLVDRAKSLDDHRYEQVEHEQLDNDDEKHEEEVATVAAALLGPSVR